MMCGGRPLPKCLGEERLDVGGRKANEWLEEELREDKG